MESVLSRQTFHKLTTCLALKKSLLWDLVKLHRPTNLHKEGKCLKEEKFQPLNSSMKERFNTCKMEKLYRKRGPQLLL